MRYLLKQQFERLHGSLADGVIQNRSWSSSCERSMAIGMLGFTTLVAPFNPLLGQAQALEPLFDPIAPWDQPDMAVVRDRFGAETAAVQGVVFGRFDLRRVDPELADEMLDSLFSIDLPTMEPIAIRLDRLDRLEGTTTVWHGSVVENAGSTLRLVSDGVSLLGDIQVGSRSFRVLPVEGDVFAIAEIDQQSFPNEAQPIAPPIPEDEGAHPTPMLPDRATSCRDSTIRLLVAFDSDATTATGGERPSILLANSLIAELNAIYDLEHIPREFELAGFLGVANPGNRSAEMLLGELQSNGDGTLDEVHEVRESLSADLVSLIVESLDACGIAYLKTRSHFQFADSAFSVVRRDCAQGYRSFAHEIGHNLGITHDRTNAYRPGVQPFAYGYQGETVRTIMAYPCSDHPCPRIPYHSDPANGTFGSPIGISHAQDPGNSANNVRALSTSACVAASWR